MHRAVEDRDRPTNVTDERGPATSSANFTEPGNVLREVHRILLRARRIPLPGPASVRLSTRWIPDTVTQQAMTQAGFTFSAAREFAARHGMTFHLDLSAEGARRYGVVIAADGSVDAAATEGLRAELRFYGP